MRLVPTALGLIFLSALSSVAHADVYNFNFQGIEIGRFGSEPIDINLAVNTKELLPESSPYYYYCAVSNVSCFIALAPAVKGSNSQVAQSYYLVTEDYLLVFDDETSPFNTEDERFNFLPSTSNTPFMLFSGPTDNPVISTGVFNFESSGYHYSVSGPATITDLSGNPVPEPSTLALLSTGILGLVGVVRRTRA